VGSGTWYEVNHESIITKNLFDKVHNRFKSMPKGRSTEKIFNYSGTMICGECGSTITAVRKTKTLSNGKSKDYTYYVCSRYTRHSCKQQPIEESVLMKGLVNIMDGVNLDKFLLKTEYEYEVNRIHKMSEQLGNSYNKKAKEKLDIRSQMKYMVENGSREERIRLLKNLGQKINLKEKAVYLD